jgi:hypothetical protein
MQAKGYGLAHIVRLLCDNGITLKEVSLRQHLHRLGPRNVTESSRVGRRDRLAIGSPAKQPGHISTNDAENRIHPWALRLDGTM